MASVAEGLQEHLHKHQSLQQPAPGPLNMDCVPGNVPTSLTVLQESTVCRAAQVYLQQLPHAAPNTSPGQSLFWRPQRGRPASSYVCSDDSQQRVSSGRQSSCSHCGVLPSKGMLGARNETGVPCTAVDAAGMVPIADSAEGTAALGCVPSKLPRFAAVAQQPTLNTSVSGKAVGTSHHVVPSLVNQSQSVSFQRIASLGGNAPAAGNAVCITSSDMLCCSAPAAGADWAASAVAAQRSRLLSPTVRSRAEAVARYRAKRATRCAASLVRYHKRKQYAEQRPRVRGRFVKASSVLDASPA